MAAFVYPMADPWVAGRVERPGTRVYRRRRAVALVSVAAAVFLAVGAIQRAQAGSGGGALTTSGSSGAAVAAQPAGAHLYVVQPGDTLWSIVRATGHAGDPRPEVDALAVQLDGRPLQIGQRLQLP